MAIKLPSSSATIKVILRQDSAIAVSDEAYEKYLETLDESLLAFVEGQKPTRFVVRKVLRFDAAQAVQNSQMKMKNNKLEFSIGYILEEVRQALTDIENPDTAPVEEHIIFKRDSDGGAAKDLIADLHAIGGVMNLFSARQNANNPTSGANGLADDLKKKSEP